MNEYKGIILEFFAYCLQLFGVFSSPPSNGYVFWDLPLLILFKVVNLETAIF